jgi:hypothetical protein
MESNALKVAACPEKDVMSQEERMAEFMDRAYFLGFSRKVAASKQSFEGKDSYA